jgi:hypothetical protein
MAIMGRTEVIEGSMMSLLLRLEISARKIGELIEEWTDAKIAAKTDGWTREKTVEKIGNLIDGRIAEKIDKPIVKWTGARTLAQTRAANCVALIGRITSPATMVVKDVTMPA